MNESESEAKVACSGVHTIIVHKDVLATGGECSERWAVPHGSQVIPLGDPRWIGEWAVSRVLIIPLGE